MSAVIVIDGVALPERLVAEEAQNHPAATPEEASNSALIIMLSMLMAS